MFDFVPLRNSQQYELLVCPLHKEYRKGTARRQSRESYDPKIVLLGDIDSGNIPKRKKCIKSSNSAA